MPYAFREEQCFREIEGLQCVQIKMTAARHTERPETLTLRIVFTNVVRRKRSMQPQTGHHSLQDHLPRDRLGGLWGGGVLAASLARA